MTHEGVDKTDFIIIHSGTGTHQLKRVARSQATFDFARKSSASIARVRPLRLTHSLGTGSLSHNARGTTPFVEAGPPSPPAVSTMVRALALCAEGFS